MKVMCNAVYDTLSDQKSESDNSEKQIAEESF